MTTRRNKLAAIALAIAALLFAIGALAPPAVQAQQSGSNNSEKVAALVEPTIVYLDINLQYYVDATYSGLDYLGPYEMSGSCTGFFVSSTGDIVTAAHCTSVESGSNLWFFALDNMLATELQEAVATGEITEADVAMVQQEAYGYWKVEGATPGSPPQLTVTAMSALGVSGEQAATGKVARVIEAKKMDEGDVALIKIEGSNTPVLELGKDSDVSTGTDVLSVGFPQNEAVLDSSVHPTFKDGQINNKGTLSGLKVPVYETSATLSHGMSGGPTVDLNAKLVGVNSFGTGEIDEFYFIAPVSLVSELLNRNGVKNELGKVDTLYRDGINAYFDGDYQLAVENLTKVLDISPGHFKAQEYKQKAAEKAADAPPTTKAAGSTDVTAKSDKAKSDSDGGGNGMLFVILGVVVLLVILVIVLIVVMKGKGKSGGPGTPAAGVPPTPAMPSTQPGVPPAPQAPTATQPAAAPTLPEQPAVSYCSGCGNAVTSGERFCPSCGKDQQSF